MHEQTTENINRNDALFVVTTRGCSRFSTVKKNTKGDTPKPSNLLWVFWVGKLKLIKFIRKIKGHSRPFESQSNSNPSNDLIKNSKSFILQQRYVILKQKKGRYLKYIKLVVLTSNLS